MPGLQWKMPDRSGQTVMKEWSMRRKKTSDMVDPIYRVSNALIKHSFSDYYLTKMEQQE